MTPIELWCELFARVLFWTVLACALYGYWLNEMEKSQGRAVDAYLNGRQGVIYL